MGTQEHQDFIGPSPDSLMGLLHNEKPQYAAASLLVRAAANAIVDALTESPEERAQRIAEEKRIEQQERSEAEQKIAEAQAALAASSPAIADSLGDIAASISYELGDGVSSSRDGALRAALSRLQQIQAELDKEAIA